MKIIFFLAALIQLANSKTCKSKRETPAPGCFKGKLLVKGGCMNYTIGVIAGDMDTTRISSSWTDENTGKAYRDVFALGSRCTFPNTIREGDEFYFTIDSTTAQNCAVCMMYYPTPPRHLSIKILDRPCSQ